MNAIEMHYLGASTSYDQPIIADSACDMLCVLRAGIAATKPTALGHWSAPNAKKSNDSNSRGS
jgi:hypothetical protein